LAPVALLTIATVAAAPAIGNIGGTTVVISTGLPHQIGEAFCEAPFSSCYDFIEEELCPSGTSSCPWEDPDYQPNVDDVDVDLRDCLKSKSGKQYHKISIEQLLVEIFSNWNSSLTWAQQWELALDTLPIDDFWNQAWAATIDDCTEFQYPPPQQPYNPPSADPMPDPPSVPSCRLANGDLSQWFVLKLPKRPESNLATLKQGQAYMVSSFGGADINAAELTYERYNITAKSPLTATIATMGTSDTLLKIKYSETRNGYTSHGYVVVDAGYGFWLLSSESVGAADSPQSIVSSLVGTGCSASYTCIPIAGSFPPLPFKRKLHAMMNTTVEFE
jgi:hypothetical protein